MKPPELGGFFLDNDAANKLKIMVMIARLNTFI